MNEELRWPEANSGSCVDGPVLARIFWVAALGGLQSCGSDVGSEQI